MTIDEAKRLGHDFPGGSNICCHCLFYPGRNKSSYASFGDETLQETNPCSDFVAAKNKAIKLAIQRGHILSLLTCRLCRGSVGHDIDERYCAVRLAWFETERAALEPAEENCRNW